jgi:hypothetical protein
MPDIYLLFLFRESQCSEKCCNSHTEDWLDVKVISVQTEILHWLFLYWILFSSLMQSIRVLVIFHSSLDICHHNNSVHLITSVHVCLSCSTRLGIRCRSIFCRRIKGVAKVNATKKLNCNRSESQGPKQQISKLYTFVFR